jgi:hypothetical protein
MRNVVARRAEAVVAELSGTPAGTARTSLDPQLVQRTST